MTNPMQAVVQEMRRYIEDHADEPLTLAAIARKSGYSAAHVQKAFTAQIGCSPKAYQAALRRQQLKSALKQGAPVSDAIYGAGYGSPSRVYEKLGQSIGMTPKQYRDGGKGVTIHYASGDTPVGTITLGATERGICFLQFGSGAQDIREEFPNADVQPMPPTHREQFNAWMESINRHIQGRQAALDLPLDVHGTAFQLMVWRYLQTIPPGEIRSYKEVAQAIGKPDAIRAVGTACGRNNVSIIIPCHRVLRGDGNLGGYRWGLEHKRGLLAMERKR